MFGQKAKNTIESLIGLATRIEGNLHFKGGLRIDGQVIGNVMAEPGTDSLLILSEKAKIQGEVHGAHIIASGEILGSVFASERLELQLGARVTGDVYYKTLEMHAGALVDGKLTHDQSGDQILQLASPKLAASHA